MPDVIECFVNMSFQFLGRHTCEMRLSFAHALKHVLPCRRALLSLGFRLSRLMRVHAYNFRVLQCPTQ